MLTQESCICEAKVGGGVGRGATALGSNLHHNPASERVRGAASGLPCSHLGPASPQEPEGSGIPTLSENSPSIRSENCPFPGAMSVLCDPAPGHSWLDGG